MEQTYNETGTRTHAGAGVTQISEAELARYFRRKMSSLPAWVLDELREQMRLRELCRTYFAQLQDAQAQINLRSGQTDDSMLGGGAH